MGAYRRPDPMGWRVWGIDDRHMNYIVIILFYFCVCLKFSTINFFKSVAIFLVCMLICFNLLVQIFLDILLGIWAFFRDLCWEPLAGKAGGLAVIPSGNATTPWPWWRDLKVPPGEPCHLVFTPWSHLVPLKCEWDQCLVSNQLKMAKRMDGTAMITLHYVRFHTAADSLFLSRWLWRRTLSCFERVTWQGTAGDPLGAEGGVWLTTSKKLDL